jgi:hypothetical protein
VRMVVTTKVVVVSGGHSNYQTKQKTSSPVPVTARPQRSFVLGSPHQVGVGYHPVTALFSCSSLCPPQLVWRRCCCCFCLRRRRPNEELKPKKAL